MASAPSPCSSATSSCPCLSRRPDTTICAPSRAKIIAAARPIPVSAPVINTTGFVITFLLRSRVKQPNSSGRATYSSSAAYGPDDGPTTFCGQPSLESLFGYQMKAGANTTIEGERRSPSDHRCQYAFVRKAARQGTRCPVQALQALRLRPLALCRFADCRLSKGPSIFQRLRLTLPP